MALLNSSYFDGRYGTRFQLQLHYEYSQNIDENYTNVVYSLYFVSLGYSGSGAATRGYINGVEVGSTTSLGVNETKLLGSQTITVWHNADGTFPNQNYSASISSPWGLGNASVSGVLSGLPTIPRASGISCSGGIIGKKTTINITRASTNFTHNIYYGFGTIGDTLIATGVSDNYQWDIPTDLYSQIPNAKKGVGYLKCNTYNNGNFIGQTNCTFIVECDEATSKPDVSATIIDTGKTLINGTTTTALTGDNKKFIKNISDAQITITATAKNGSTISNYTTKCGTKESVGNNTTLSSIDGNNFVINAIDSRGYDNPQTYTPVIIDYIPLTLSIDLKRPSPTSNEVKAKINGSYFNKSFGSQNNSLTLQFIYRESGKTDWSDPQTLVPTFDGNSFNGNLSLGTNYDYHKVYEFKIIATDKIKSEEKTQNVSKGIPTFFIGEDRLEFNGEKILDPPKVLYDNASGNSGTITLSETAANYKYIEIFYLHDNSGSRYGSTRVYSPNGKTACLKLIWRFSDPGAQTVYRLVKINGNSITTEYGGAFNVGVYGTWYGDQNDMIKIVRVEGYK